ncbi:ferrous iron transport protein A [Haloimpatiens sp. FM7315]|uniref:FeoA family protein n=1 Tax=Haloimpatiens sp. FM7315 TaxID=3298609 RepID=UPI0035A3477C
MNLLCNISKGKESKVKCLLSTGALKERMLALGLTEGTYVKVLRKGPCDNLTLYNIRGAMIALRKEEASLICVY